MLGKSGKEAFSWGNVRGGGDWVGFGGNSCRKQKWKI